MGFIPSTTQHFYYTIHVSQNINKELYGINLCGDGVYTLYRSWMVCSLSIRMCVCRMCAESNPFQEFPSCRQKNVAFGGAIEANAQLQTSANIQADTHHTHTHRPTVLERKSSCFFLGTYITIHSFEQITLNEGI